MKGGFQSHKVNIELCLMFFQQVFQMSFALFQEWAYLDGDQVSASFRSISCDAKGGNGYKFLAQKSHDDVTELTTVEALCMIENFP